LRVTIAFLKRDVLPSNFPRFVICDFVLPLQFIVRTFLTETLNFFSTARAMSIFVAPGATGELVYTFTRPGTVLIGCHEPGHYALGMRAVITVS